jgi:hypothetical protein
LRSRSSTRSAKLMAMLRSGSINRDHLSLAAMGGDRDARFILGWPRQSRPSLWAIVKLCMRNAHLRWLPLITANKMLTVEQFSRFARREQALLAGGRIYAFNVRRARNHMIGGDPMWSEPAPPHACFCAALVFPEHPPFWRIGKEILKECRIDCP